MCGRFTLAERLNQLQARFEVQEIPFAYEPSYNIAPTDEIVTVTSHEEKNQFKLLTWGIPIKEGQIINARDDKIEDSPFYQLGITYNRCLVPATGFYEWKKLGSRKIPYYITSKSNKVFSFAGFSHYLKQSQTRYVAFFTTTPNEHVAQIHDRMPVILNKKDEKIWLNRDEDIEKIKELIRPYPAELMQSHIVSSHVNNPSNDYPQLIRPVTSLSKFF